MMGRATVLERFDKDVNRRIFLPPTEVTMPRTRCHGGRGFGSSSSVSPVHIALPSTLANLLNSSPRAHASRPRSADGNEVHHPQAGVAKVGRVRG